MSSVQLYNSKLEISKKLNTDLDFSAEATSSLCLHQVIRTLLLSRRQGNACTKNKALVRGGGKKPFKQKGTGRARQGSNRSPLMPGGGTVFGPMPRSYEMKLNKKTMLTAIHAVLADKFNAGKLIIVDKFESSGKTKEAFKVLEGSGFLPALVVCNHKDSRMIKAVRNIKSAKALAVEGFSVLEAVRYENLLIEKDAFEALAKKIG